MVQSTRTCRCSAPGPGKDAPHLATTTPGLNRGPEDRAWLDRCCGVNRPLHLQDGGSWCATDGELWTGVCSPESRAVVGLDRRRVAAPALLDAEGGGYFRVAPDQDEYVSRQLYFPDTAILITRFMTPDGVGEVHDFMPIAGGAPTDRHRLVRRLRVVRGTMRFVMEIQPRFDYARKAHKLELSEDGAVFRAEGLELTVHSVGEPGTSLREQGVTVERHGDGLRVRRTLRAGEAGGVMLETMGGPATPAAA